MVGRDSDLLLLQAGRGRARLALVRGGCVGRSHWTPATSSGRTTPEPPDFDAASGERVHGHSSVLTGAPAVARSRLVFRHVLQRITAYMSPAADSPSEPDVQSYRRKRRGCQ